MCDVFLCLAVLGEVAGGVAASFFCVLHNEEETREGAPASFMMLFDRARYNHFFSGIFSWCFGAFFGTREERFQ